MKIPGYPHYDIDDSGNVTNSKGKLLKQHVVSGYRKVALSSCGKTKSVSVHRTVALAFLPNDEGKRTVNHIDGNKLNNHVNNLEWCSYSDNEKHAYRTGLKRPSTGEDHGRSKLSAQDVEDIRGRLLLGEPSSSIAVSKGVCYWTINNIRKGANWSSPK